MVFKRKFLFIYKGYFLFNYPSKLAFFKELLFERMKKIRKFHKNGIRKKILNFERMLFDQTTSSHEDPIKLLPLYLKMNLQSYHKTHLMVSNVFTGWAWNSLCISRSATAVAVLLVRRIVRCLRRMLRRLWRSLVTFVLESELGTFLLHFVLIKTNRLVTLHQWLLQYKLK